MTTMTQKWRLEGRLEGRVEEKRHLILRAYQRKFGLAPLNIVDFVQRVSDLNRLDEMFDQAIMAESADELHALWVVTF